METGGKTTMYLFFLLFRISFARQIAPIGIIDFGSNKRGPFIRQTQFHLIRCVSRTNICIKFGNRHWLQSNDEKMLFTP